MFIVTVRRISNGYIVNVMVPGVQNAADRPQEQYVANSAAVAALLDTLDVEITNAVRA